MSQFPREPRPGDVLDGAWGQQVVRYLKAITPRSGPGVNARRYASGTIFEGVRQPNPTPDTFPFQVRQSDTAKVTVVFGQVHSITPTISGTALDNATPPQLTIGATGVIYLDVTVDGSGVPTDAEVKTAASLPANSSTHGYYTIATVTLTSGAISAINQSITNSLEVAKCGVSTYFFGAV